MCVEEQRVLNSTRRVTVSLRRGSVRPTDNSEQDRDSHCAKWAPNIVPHVELECKSVGGLEFLSVGRLARRFREKVLKRRSRGNVLDAKDDRYIRCSRRVFLFLPERYATLFDVSTLDR